MEVLCLLKATIRFVSPMLLPLGKDVKERKIEKFRPPCGCRFLRRLPSIRIQSGTFTIVSLFRVCVYSSQSRAERKGRREKTIFLIEHDSVTMKWKDTFIVYD